MNEQQDIGEEIAQIVWESSVAFSNPNKPRATKWSDVSTSAARQSARHVASDLLASPVIRRIQAEAIRDAARFLRSGENPQRGESMVREHYAMDDAGYQLRRMADRIEKGSSDV